MLFPRHRVSWPKSRSAVRRSTRFIERMLMSEHEKAYPVFDFNFVEDGGQVMAHGCLGDVQLERNLPVSVSTADQFDDLAFPARESLDCALHGINAFPGRSS